ncbi:MAG: ketopantoate reductase family protein [Spirochaetales bacterium]|nr:ketopantoate reductase family protein [Spirochaetales bacterium]
MESIKTVAVIGAGALGLLFMDSITKISDINSFFLADEERFFKLNNKVFNINGDMVQFPVKCMTEISDSVDLVLICVKNYHLDGIQPLLTKICGKNTIIISVLNGITSELFLEEHLPESHIIYSAVLGMDAVTLGNSLQFTKKGKFLIGSKNNEITEAVTMVKEFFEIIHYDYIISNDIHKEIWYKWMINIGVNQLSAITGATYGSFQKNRDLQILMEDTMKETIKVAALENVLLTSNDISSWYKVLNTLGPNGKTSMLQDIEAKRKTEVESFSGDLIKYAQKHGVDVPINKMLYQLIKIKESLFMYDSTKGDISLNSDNL